MLTFYLQTELATGSDTNDPAVPQGTSDANATISDPHSAFSNPVVPNYHRDVLRTDTGSERPHLILSANDHTTASSIVTPLLPPSPAQARRTRIASAQWAEGLFLKVVNIVAYSLFSWFNIYFIVSPGSVSEYIKQTYFTPANSVFFVWPIIHFLLLGTVIYQFTSPRAKAVVIDDISWRFPLLAVFNTILVAFWVNEDYIFAFALSLLSTATAWHIYVTVEEITSPITWSDKLFVHLPFSVWRAGTNVVVLLTAFQAFGVDAVEHPAGAWTKVFVLLAL